MPSSTAATFDLVPSTLVVLSDWARWEALLADVPVLLELVEVVHEPLLAVVVVLVVARLFAFCANIMLAISITRKVAIMVFFKAPPLRVSQGLHRGSAEIAVLSQAPLRTRSAPGLSFLVANRQRVLIALSQTAYVSREHGWVISR